ncbi:MAG TPA: divergent polysaccharide deacetylase family protein [Azospirillum sp.]
MARRRARPAGKGLTATPFLLALGAVAVVFGVAVGGAVLTGRTAPAKAVTARTVTTVSAAVPVEPPVESAQPAITEPEPGVAFDEPEVVAPPPPAPVPAPAQAALLAPPVPPSPVPGPAPGAVPLWRRNAVPFAAPGDRPVIAIVIDDLGVDRKRSARTVKLPGPLTLAWLPYAEQLRDQTRAAQAAGHELLLHIPMEPSVHADPGPDALLTRLDNAEIQRRFAQALASFDGYVGVNNHMGSRFTADRAAMAPVLGEIQRRGLLWLDSRTTPRSAGTALAEELRMPHAGRDIFLDNVQTVGAVRAQLAKTEAVARQQGFAIAIGHPHDATLAALSTWLPEVRKRGFALVPVSAIVRARCSC